MQLVVARRYNFLDWAALTLYAEAVPLFEYAAESVIDGDPDSLRMMLREHPDLVHARSTRICNFDPPVHRATLLHYIAANDARRIRAGIEQRSSGP